VGLKREVGGRNIVNSSFEGWGRRKKEEGKFYIIKELFDLLSDFGRINKYKQSAGI
jgi:hypothetical protein